jgi:tripartite-type tricarboxylate transporter receptor subunit TctC
MIFKHLVALLTVGLLLVVPAQAAEKSTEFTVYFGPGGPSDLSTRAVAKFLPNYYTVVNRPGGGGQIAIRATDGKDAIINVTMSQIFVTNPMIHKEKLGYRTRDLSVIAIIGTMPNVLVCNKEAGFKSFADFKANTRSLTFGIAGYGSSEHVATEVLVRQTGLKHTIVPYSKGGRSGLLDLLAGRIDCMFANYPTVKSTLDSGNDKVVAILSSEDIQIDNVVPWEQAYGKKFPFTSPLGIAVHNKTLSSDLRFAARIRKDLARAFNSTMAMRELQAIGINPVGSINGADITKAFNDMDNLRQFLVRENIQLVKD